MEDLRKRIEELEAELEDCRQSYEDEKYRAEQYRDMFFEGLEYLKDIEYKELNSEELEEWSANVMRYIRNNRF